MVATIGIEISFARFKELFAEYTLFLGFQRYKSMSEKELEIKNLAKVVEFSCHILDVTFNLKDVQNFQKQIEANYPPGFLEEMNIKLSYDKVKKVLREFMLLQAFKTGFVAVAAPNQSDMFRKIPLSKLSVCINQGCRNLFLQTFTKSEIEDFQNKV